jgi:hypothetical protein
MDFEQTGCEIVHWLRTESSGGSCKHNNEPSGSTNADNFLTS